MNQDFHTPSTPKIVDTPPIAPSPPPTLSINKKPAEEGTAYKEPLVPYLASVTAFVLLLISTFYSLFALIDYALSKSLIKETASTDIFSSYTAGFDNYVAVGALAGFIVSLPAVAIMALVTQRYEKSEPWRLAQKWRRVVYIVGAIILVSGIVGVVTTSLYTIMSTVLNLDAGGAYTSYMPSDAPKNQDGSIITKAVLSGLSGVLFLGLGLFVLGGNYTNRHRWATWATCGLLLITGLGVGGYDLVKVNESVKKIENQTKSQSGSYNYSSSGLGQDTTTSEAYTDYYDNIERVQEDLRYYADDHQGLYPTKEQWDNGEFKSSGASFSSTEYLDSVTYAPSECTATGCKSYTLKGKDANGEEKTVTDKTNSTTY